MTAYSIIISAVHNTEIRRRSSVVIGSDEEKDLSNSKAFRDVVFGDSAHVVCETAKKNMVDYKRNKCVVQQSVRNQSIRREEVWWWRLRVVRAESTIKQYSAIADEPRDTFTVTRSHMQWRGWPPETRPLVPHMCYHAEFGRSGLKGVGINTA